MTEMEKDIQQLLADMRYMKKAVTELQNDMNRLFQNGILDKMNIRILRVELILAFLLLLTQGPTFLKLLAR